jgi:hypothetical protein
MEESHTKDQSPKAVSKMELRAKRSKISGSKNKRERATRNFFSGGRRCGGLKG